MIVAAAAMIQTYQLGKLAALLPALPSGWQGSTVHQGLLLSPATCQPAMQSCCCFL